MNFCEEAPMLSMFSAIYKLNEIRDGVKNLQENKEHRERLMKVKKISITLSAAF